MTKEQAQSRIMLVQNQKEARKDRAQEILRMLSNDFGSTSQSDGVVVNILAPNFMMATRRRLIAQLYPSDPRFHCTPRVRGFEGRASVISSMLQYYWKELGVIDTMRRIIDDVIIYGYGAAKIGMGSLVTGYREREDEQKSLDRISKEHERLLNGEVVHADRYEPHDLDLDMHIHILNQPELLEHPDAATILFNFTEHVKEHEEMAKDPVPTFPTVVGKGPAYDWPFIESVGPNLYWDPNVINPQRSAYVIHEVKRRLLDVKNDPLYTNTENLSADSYNEEEMQAYSQQYGESADEDVPLPEELATVTLYEEWDAEHRTVATYAKDVEDPIRPPDEDAWPTHIEGFPFEWLVFTEIPGETHGPGILEFIKWPQKFLMRLYSELATHSDRSSVKYEIDENKLSPRETNTTVENKLAEPTSHVGIFTQDGPAINVIQTPPIDGSEITLINLLQNVIYENSIMSSEIGAVGQSDTATQASIIASAANINIGDMVERINRFQSRVARDLIGIVRQFGPEEQSFYIVTPKGQEWENYNINDIQADWQVTVEMPSPYQSQTEKQEWLNMFHMFSSIMDPVGKQNFMMEGMRLFGIKQPDLYVEHPSVETQSNIHSENNLLMLGQPVQASQGEQHAEHAEGHQMAIQEWSKYIYQKMDEIIQQNPSLQNQGQEEMIQQLVMSDPMSQKLLMAIELAQKHIQEHQYLQENEGRMESGEATRRRQAVPYPTGNPGRTESIFSNQKQGT